MIWKFLLWAVLLFFIVRFILNFVLPLIGITAQTSRKIKEMQRQMNKMQQKQQQQEAAAQKPIEGEYIEYEEMK